MPDYRSQYEPVARQYAAEYGLDPEVFARQISAESGWNPTAGSPAGAQGIAQIMPGTAKGWGVDPMDPNAALRAAAQAMGKYVKSYHGNYRKALAAYNAGPGAVAKYGGVPPYGETQAYIKEILGGYTPQGGGRAPVEGVRGASTGADANTSSDDNAALAMLFDDDPVFAALAASTPDTQATERVWDHVNDAAKVPPGAGGLLDTALSQVGKTAAQAMQYIRAGGGTGMEPWCGDFVMWTFKKNGLKPPPARSVTALLAWAQGNGSFTQNARPGDMALFDWNKDGTPDHVGFYRGRGKGGINTVEGNTSTGRGAGVAKKVRQAGDIIGYVRSQR